MKILLISFSLLSLSFLDNAAQSGGYEKHFFDKTLRIDYYHTGSAADELITIDQMYRYGKWAGSKTNLLDDFNNGAYYIKVYDQTSRKLVYSKGFDSYFKEYQTTGKAIGGIQKTFHETALIPAPKNKIIFEIEKRDKRSALQKIFSAEIDPADYGIIEETISDNLAIVYNSISGGEPAVCVDVAVIGEGYAAAEKEKFESDLKKFSDLLLGSQPYKSFKDNFNIYGIYKPSEESGTDIPGAGIFKNTILNTTFYSLGSERYLLTEDNKSLRDLAALVPYDAIFIMVNHQRYGGGGIYNFYCTFTTDNQFSGYVFLHEFGHSFSGLADEYYTSDVAYNEFYPEGVEPVEPNITRETIKERVKWKHLIDGETETPTNWNKSEYDQIDAAWQMERRTLNEKISELKKQNASAEKIASLENEYNKKDKLHSERVNEFFTTNRHWGRVGVFEGAGYASEGIYRPMLDCLMFSKGAADLCRVCKEHAIKVIKNYIE